MPLSSLLDRSKCLSMPSQATKSFHWLVLQKACAKKDPVSLPDVMHVDLDCLSMNLHIFRVGHRLEKPRLH